MRGIQIGHLINKTLRARGGYQMVVLHGHVNDTFGEIEIFFGFVEYVFHDHPLSRRDQTMEILVCNTSANSITTICVFPTRQCNWLRIMQKQKPLEHSSNLSTSVETISLPLAHAAATWVLSGDQQSEQILPQSTWSADRITCQTK